MGIRSIGFLLILVLVLAIGSMIDLARAQSGNRGDDPAGDCRPTTAYIGDDGRWHARIGRVRRISR